MAIEISRDVRRYFVAFLIFVLAGEIIWVNLKNIELKKSLSEQYGTPPARSLHRGEEAPSFELSSLEGQPFNLDDVRGVPVILIYFIPGCRGCEEEIPLWRCLYESRNSTERFMFGVSDSKREEIKSFVVKNGLEFPVLIDSAGGFAKAYHIEAVPAVIRIDERGRIGGL